MFASKSAAVSTHSRPKAAGACLILSPSGETVSTHSRPKAAGISSNRKSCHHKVSTHSRPKAAGQLRQRLFRVLICFNTQPPEGGWGECAVKYAGMAVSTHSRPKAAGPLGSFTYRRPRVSTHSRPKAAGRNIRKTILFTACFNTQPPEGGWGACSLSCLLSFAFQHTAARRRLANRLYHGFWRYAVSTHSRPKAAGGVFFTPPPATWRFNTQPPEGGWAREAAKVGYLHCFNTQPPEGGWRSDTETRLCEVPFQHTAARRRLARS